MNFFLFSGVPNSGKTTAVKNIYDHLSSNGYIVTFAVIPPLPLTSSLAPQDFSCIMSNGTRTIIIHSACDAPDVIDRLIDLYNANPGVDAIISSIRAPISSIYGHPLDPRTYFLDHLQPYSPGNYCLELPVGKINGNRAFYTTVLLWHHSTITSTAHHILSNSPFNL